MENFLFHKVVCTGSADAQNILNLINRIGSLIKLNCVIVIQNDTGNKHAPTLIVATVTTRIHKKANMPTHFVIYDNPAFKEASVVQLEQIRTIDKSRIDNYLGKVTPREMVAIEKALSVSLAMEQLKKRPTKHKAKRTKE